MRSKQVLTLLLILLAGLCFAGVNKADTDEIAEQIAALIDTTEPIFIELATGEWTNPLDVSLRKALLAKGADIRELTLIAPYPVDEPDSLDAPSLTPIYDLSRYSLPKANLVQISSDITTDTIEKKRFLSYQQETQQTTTFTVKQIRLPEYQLRDIDEYARKQTLPNAALGNSPHLRWFEPLFASLAAASLVFLLWTTE